MARDDEIVTITIREGDVAADDSWVYVWVRAENDRGVIYVGATGMRPETRAWLHLNHDDSNIGRVRARYPDATKEPLRVFALRLPDGTSRQTVRTALTARLDHDRLLSTKYVGDPPPARIEVAAEVSPLVDKLASVVARHVGR